MQSWAGKPNKVYRKALLGWTLFCLSLSDICLCHSEREMRGLNLINPYHSPSLCYWTAFPKLWAVFWLRESRELEQQEMFYSSSKGNRVPRTRKNYIFWLEKNQKFWIYCIFVRDLNFPWFTHLRYHYNWFHKELFNSITVK